MKLGVIIARFQTDILTDGHLALINYVKQNCDEILIILGSPQITLTDKNPLSFEIRKEMIENTTFIFNIKEIIDTPDDKEWSENIDGCITSQVFSYKKPTDIEITLYGSRDSFIPYYLGFYKTEYFDSHIKKISATEKRKHIAQSPIYYNDDSFRRGIIYTVENKFPTVYPTVDIALIKKQLSSKYILLGRKPGKYKYVFPGGFVDPTDLSLEEAAKRELGEEVIGIKHSKMKYLSSIKIDDFRYKGTKDGIMTTFFMTKYKSGTPIAGDDLEEVRWFWLQEAYDFISDFHKPLLDILLNQKI